MYVVCLCNRNAKCLNTFATLRDFEWYIYIHSVVDSRKLILNFLEQIYGGKIFYDLEYF